MESQPEIDVLLLRIREYRKAANLSYSALAQRAGLSRAALVGMDREGWGPTSSTIRAIEQLMPSGWRVGDPLPQQEAA